MKYRSVVIWCMALAFGLSGCRTPEPPSEKGPPLKIRKVLEGARRTSFRYTSRGELTPTAIVIHSMHDRLFFASLQAMEERNLAIHLLIDEDGSVYQLMDDLEERGKAARGLDESAIHVGLVGGIGKTLLENRGQMKRTADVIKMLTARYAIPLNNHDVEGKRGVFSHTQVKYRFGGFLPNDPLEPGEEVVKHILEAAGGKYYPEPEWKDRGGKEWLFIAESQGGNAARGEWDRGRGITPTPRAELPAFVQDRHGRVPEERRLKYIDRGKIKITGVVLHFTATKEYKTTLRALEDRRLWSTIIVDTDGSGYQVLDRLEDKPAAAAGTNDQCVQIEIVGKGEPDLLSQRMQKKKVMEIVRQLSEKYDIPKDNRDVESNRGIFSHGQAKKRFGRSAWLSGDDFDPGETYMREVIEGIGGTYYAEKDWKDRRDEKWVFLYDTWAP